MKKVVLILMALALFKPFFAGAQVQQFDWGYNIDGDTYCYEGLDCTFDIADTGGLEGVSALPLNIDTSGIDLLDVTNAAATGLGTTTVTVAGEGPHFVIFYTDLDIGADPYDETGVSVNSPIFGQMWEIDEPGDGFSGDGTEATTYFGDLLQFNFVIDGMLDNRAFFDALDQQNLGHDGDTAMALGLEFELAAGETATINFAVTNTMPTSTPPVFHLQQSDSGGGNNVYFSSSLDISSAGPRDDILTGFDNGIWVLKDNSQPFSNMHPARTEGIIAGNLDGDAQGKDDMIVDFGPGAGIWVLYNDDEATWRNLHPLSPEVIVLGNVDGSGQEDMIVDFGPGIGIWVLYNNDEATWTKLHPLSPEVMATADIDGDAQGKDDMIFDFGPGIGIWVLYNDDETTWEKLHPLSPDAIVLGDVDGGGQDDMIIDFGPGIGIWVLYNNDEATWTKLHPLSPEVMASGDIDGSGLDDMIFDFGPGTGIWVLYNNDEATWRNLHPLSPEAMVVGDTDGSGQDDMIVDFGPGAGIWVLYNNDEASWTKLHDASPEICAIGNIDGI